jgi:HD-GYP domain-containing protein (c-di-GMP phosphodiesterase class II)
VFGAVAARVVEDFAYRERARTTAFYVSEFLAPRLTPQDFLLGRESRRVQFEFAVRNLVGRAWIQRVIVWSPEGQVLYSTDPHLVGRNFPFSSFLRLAVDGQIAWQRVGAKNGITALPQELEVFIPVIVPGSTRPVAVYDIVSKLSDLAPAIIQLKRSVGTSVVLGILVLYATLFSIVHKASRDLERQQANLREALVGTIRSLANAVDSRDQATGNHSSRVAEYAEAIAFAMNLPASEIREAQASGYLHDLGKIGIPDALLMKRGPLTKQEWITIQKHSICGYEILRPVSMPEQVKLAVRHSHERWDGNGYPDGLAGEQIPIIARVVAVADTYEALTTARPYRAAWTSQEAVEEIRRCSGTQFDPSVVDAFLKIWPQWAERAEKRELVSKVIPLLRSGDTGTDGTSTLKGTRSGSCSDTAVPARCRS